MATNTKSAYAPRPEKGVGTLPGYTVHTKELNPERIWLWDA
jgi:hypothetical protein